MHNVKQNLETSIFQMHLSLELDLTQEIQRFNGGSDIQFSTEKRKIVTNRYWRLSSSNLRHCHDTVRLSRSLNKSTVVGVMYASELSEYVV